MFRDDLLELVQVDLGGVGELGALVGDPAEQHRLVGFQRHSDDALIVEVTVADDEVEDRRTVGHIDLLGGVIGPHRLFGEVEAAFVALLVLDERVGFQVFHRQFLLHRERIVTRDEHVQGSTEERMELQVLFRILEYARRLLMQLIWPLSVKVL